MCVHIDHKFSPYALFCWGSHWFEFIMHTLSKCDTFDDGNWTTSSGSQSLYRRMRIGEHNERNHESKPVNHGRTSINYLGHIFKCLVQLPIKFHSFLFHDDVIKWKQFTRYWPFVRGIHRSPVNSPHKGQWRRASIFSFICAWINCGVNNRKAGDWRRHRTYDVTVMSINHSMHRGLNKVVVFKKKMMDWTLRWRHNERECVSNHQPHDCLLNRLFRRRLKKTSKLRVTGLCEGNSPVTGEFPAQRAINAEHVSIWWRHHENIKSVVCLWNVQP